MAGALVGGLGGGGTVGTAVARLILDSTQFNAGLAGAQGKMAGFGRGLSSVGGALTRGLSLPLALVGGAAVKMALDFEGAFTKIQANSNLTAQEVSKFKEEVLSLAGETAQSPQELANALYFLASAGLKSSEVMGVLELAAKGSAAGLGDTADLAQIAAQALNAYAKQGLTAVDVFDTLTAAVQAGTAAPQDYAAALGDVLSIAARAKIPFDQVVGSLAALSNVGVSVNEGVTQMTQLITSMLVPTKEAAANLDAFGLSAEQLRGALAEGGLPAALDLLQESTGGNIEALRKIFPNIRALRGELGLTGDNAASGR